MSYYDSTTIVQVTSTITILLNTMYILRLVLGTPLMTNDQYRYND